MQVEHSSEPEPGEMPAIAWYRRVRAQLAFSYLLSGGVAAILALAFGYVAFNMLLIRTAINTVERQVALIVELTAQRAELFARLAPTGPRTGPGTSPGARPPGPPPPPPGTPPPLAGRGLSRSGVRSRATCRDAKGATSVYTFPQAAEWIIPDWLTADRFAGIAFDDNRTFVRGYAKSEQGTCTVEVLVETPVDESLAKMISEASAMDLEIAMPPSPGDPARPRLPAMAWSNLVGRFPNGLPAFGSGNSWRTGEPVIRPLFFVRPDVATTWAQLTQFGSRRITAMGVIAGAFFFVELLAAWLAFRLARRIVRSVNSLSEAADQYGAGNLGYRIRGLRNDQLGRLGNRFNRMAESIHNLIVRTKENERMEEEIRLARTMQESLLPSQLPVIDRMRLAAVCFPARNVSGDIYDVLDLGAGRVGLLCADVSGKGVPAGMMMSNVQAMVRTMVESWNGERPSPAALLERLNREVFRYSPPNTFVTLLWAEYDGEKRLLRWANAGHCPALLLANGTETWLAEGGLPVGMFPHAKYQNFERVLPEGAMLVTYTDGVVEAERDDGEAFGEAGLANVCRIHAGAGPDGIIHAIVDSVQSFVDGREIGDDLTIVVLQSC